MRENTDQKNSKYGHFLSRDNDSLFGKEKLLIFNLVPRAQFFKRENPWNHSLEINAAKDGNKKDI